MEGDTLSFIIKSIRTFLIHESVINLLLRSYRIHKKVEKKNVT